MKQVIRVNIVSDVVCPWCYIGKRRLENAMMALVDKYDFDVSYHPFELNPYTPEEGYDQKAYLENKFGGKERYLQLTGQVTSVAALEGLHFDFSIQKKSPNTFHAHRVIWYAYREQKQLEVSEAFFKAYFTNGIDLTKKENLIMVAANAGLDKQKLTAFLNSDEGEKEVKAELEYFRSIGITSVPFYIINNKYSLSGAQQSDVFIRALSEIAMEETIDGGACDIDGENC